MSSKSKPEKIFNVIDFYEGVTQNASSMNPLKNLQPVTSTYRGIKYLRSRDENKISILKGMTLSIEKIEKLLSLDDTNKELFVDTKEVLDKVKVLYEIVKDYFYDFEGAINRVLEKALKRGRGNMSDIEKLLIDFYEQYDNLKNVLIAHNDRIAVKYTTDSIFSGKFHELQTYYTADNSVEGDSDKELRYIARPKGTFLAPRYIFSSPDNSQLMKEARERQITLPEHGFYLGQKLGFKGFRFKELDLDDYPKQKDKYEFLKVKRLNTTIPDSSYEALDDFVKDIKAQSKISPSIVVDGKTNGGIRKRITRKGRKRQLRKKYSKTRKHY